jgi:hypothetical protein
MLSEIKPLDELVKHALVRSFHLGQTYWDQANSDSTRQWNKADETHATFKALLAETVDEVRFYMEGMP